MILNLVTLPNENLRKPSTKVDGEFLMQIKTQDFLDNMVKTMYADDGIGLAAPQVGENICICTIGKSAFPKKFKAKEGSIDTKKDLILINPEYKIISNKKETDLEGCLSVPGYFGRVTRFKRIEVTALDRNGEKFVFEAANFFARVIQHEIDHLRGILYIDIASKMFKDHEPQDT